MLLNHEKGEVPCISSSIAICNFLKKLQHPGRRNFTFNKNTVGSNTGQLYVNGKVGRDTRELCQLGPFVMVSMAVNNITLLHLQYFI